MEWIPVSERFPDTDRQVLVYHIPIAGYRYPPSGMISIGWCYIDWAEIDDDGIFVNYSKFFGLRDETLGEVTHWMELPKFPKSE